MYSHIHRRRSSADELRIWKERVAELHWKESICPGCIKAKKLNEGTMQPTICENHQRIRKEMATGTMKLRS